VRLALAVDFCLGIGGVRRAGGSLRCGPGDRIVLVAGDGRAVGRTFGNRICSRSPPTDWPERPSVDSLHPRERFSDLFGSPFWAGRCKPESPFAITQLHGMIEQSTKAMQFAKWNCCANSQPRLGRRSTRPVMRFPLKRIAFLSRVLFEFL